MRHDIGQLSAFNGGWTLEAAEAISPSPETPALLAGLVDKSLVVMDNPSGEPRYHLLETIYEYARERLQDAGELEEALNRRRITSAAVAVLPEPVGDVITTERTPAAK